MAFTGNKQTATYHIDEYVQDRCALASMPEDKLVKSETEFSGPVEGRSARRDGTMPMWKTCAHCARAREKALNPPPEPAEVAPRAKRETKKAREAREAAEAAAAAESGEAPAEGEVVEPVAEAEGEAVVDLFAEAPTA